MVNTYSVRAYAIADTANGTLVTLVDYNKLLTANAVLTALNANQARTITALQAQLAALIKPHITGSAGTRE